MQQFSINSPSDTKKKKMQLVKNKNNFDFGLEILIIEQP